MPTPKAYTLEEAARILRAGETLVAFVEVTHNSLKALKEGRGNPDTIDHLLGMAEFTLNEVKKDA